jgi:hypothetical protein
MLPVARALPPADESQLEAMQIAACAACLAVAVARADLGASATLAGATTAIACGVMLAIGGKLVRIVIRNDR